MAIARGTTPTFILSFSDEDLDLTQASHVYVTFRSGGNVLTKSDSDIDVEAKKISVFLTQEETLSFKGDVEIQANWTSSGGMRAASEITTYVMSPQLLQRVLE